MMKSAYHYLLIGFLACGLFLVGCNTSTTKTSYEMAEAGQNQFTINVPDGLSMDAIERAIQFSLTNREWSVVESDVGSIEAVLSHRGISATLDISYDEDVIRIESEATDDDGKALVPLRWIEFLREDIQKQLISAASL